MSPSIKLRLSFLRLLAFVFFASSFFVSYGQGTVAGISPATTTIPTSLNLVITGSGTNFTAATGFRLEHTGSSQFYNATSFNAPGPTTATAAFSLPPNAPLGTYTLISYLAPPLVGALTINPGPGSNYGLVSGKYIFDNNNNCIQDVGDSTVAGKLITFMPGPFYCTTDANGNYSAWLPLGSYTATTTDLICGQLVACPVGQTHAIGLPTSLSTDTGNDFFIQGVSSCGDVLSFLHVSNLRPGISTRITGSVRNLGPNLATNVDYVLTVPVSIIGVGSIIPTPTSVVGNVYTWSFPSIPAGQAPILIEMYIVPNIGSLGDTAIFTYNSPPGLNDPPANNHGTVNRVITGSYDPNDKRVWDTTGTNADGPVDPNTSVLDYMVRFQNTGNDTAFTVVIRDTIDPQLDLSTLQIMGNSHPVQYSVTGQNHVAFTFPNILLVDSNANEPLSHGYVAYRISLNPGVTAPATIENAAGIYFDFNDPVQTNTVSTTLCRHLNSGYSYTNTGLNFAFSGLADTSANTWAWDFGDGNTSTLQNPSHTYAASGQYAVCLTVGNGCRTEVICDTAYTCQHPLPQFSSSFVGNTISFSDQSHSSTTTWSWDFGDGSSSSLQNPSHTYAASGTYYVCLTATNGCVSQTFCDSASTCLPVNEAFNASSSGLTAAFTDMSNSSTVSWAWDFGDGTTSTLQNPTHVYTTVGSYQVCLTVSNGCDTATTCDSVFVCTPINEAFAATTTPLSANFSDMSDLSANSWSWTFGDGGTSTLQNPSHVYAAGGTYQVCLTVSNGCDTATACDSITVCPAINEAYGFSVLGNDVTFTDMSGSSVNTWAWTFGDGGTSTLQNPVHQYASGGAYNVCLTVSNSCESATVCQNVDLCIPTNGSFNFSVQPALVVDFVGVADPSVNSWSWDFGDGQTSTLQSPSHQYATGGAYNPCLTVSNACSTNTSCSILSLVGVENPWIENLSVSPNPSDGLFSIRGSNLPVDNLVLRVYDVQGKVIRQALIPAFSNTLEYVLDIEDQPSGLYLIELSNGVKKVSMKVQKQ